MYRKNDHYLTKVWITVILCTLVWIIIINIVNINIVIIIYTANHIIFKGKIIVLFSSRILISYSCVYNI
jgi:hypothetical protein